MLAAALTALAACDPASPSVSAASSQAVTSGPDGMMGQWSVEILGFDGLTYSGVLDVTQRTGDGLYKGDLALQFQQQSGGQSSEVEQDARVTVDGNTVIVICTRAVVVTEDADYTADNFLLMRSGPNLLKGYDKDTHSIVGNVTMTKK
jgi:hypothetical protein